MAERSTANPEKPPARNSVRIPEGRNPLLASIRRGSLGFAGLAPHSGRSSVPFRLTLFRDRRYSFQLQLQGQIIPDKQRSIRKTPYSVKSVRYRAVKKLVEKRLLAPELRDQSRRSLTPVISISYGQARILWALLVFLFPLAGPQISVGPKVKGP